MPTWPALSKGGYDRWRTRLHRLNPRVAACVPRPALTLRDTPGAAQVSPAGEFAWLDVDHTWLYHRARMQGTTSREMRSVAAYVLAVVYARHAGAPLEDLFAGMTLAALQLPLAPAQQFAASLNPLDALESRATLAVRLSGLAAGYAC